MPDPLRCTRCLSDVVIPRVRVLDRDEGGTHRDLQVEVQRRPNVDDLQAAGTVHDFSADLRRLRVCGALRRGSARIARRVLAGRRQSDGLRIGRSSTVHVKRSSSRN